MDALQNGKNPVKLSKKRYGELERILREMFEEEVTRRVLEAVCKVLEYDPEQGLYSKGKLRELAEKRRLEAAARGKSTYELMGHREYYLKNKVVLNKKKLEYYHAKKGRDDATTENA